MRVNFLKLRQKPVSHLAVALAIFSALIALGIFGIVYSQGDPSTPQTNPGSNFEVCTGGVNQDACYNPSSSITRLNWTYSSTAYGQMAFWVQVDNNGNLDGNFPSPEINTGWINSSNKYYDILPGSLQPDTTYYWKVAVADNHGSWSGWTCADASFTTPAYCSDFSLTKTNDIYATIVNKQAAESSKTTIKVTPLNGFNSAVTLSVESVSPSLPGGSSWSFSRNPLTEAYYSSGSEFKVSIGAGLASSQTYTIVIKGSGGSPLRERWVTVYLNTQVKSPGWEEF